MPRSAELPGPPIYLFKNNTDSAGNSYGCHGNYLMARATPFVDIMRRDHETAFGLVTAIVYPKDAAQIRSSRAPSCLTSMNAQVRGAERAERASRRHAAGGP